MSQIDPNLDLARLAYVADFKTLLYSVLTDTAQPPILQSYIAGEDISSGAALELLNNQVITASSSTNPRAIAGVAKTSALEGDPILVQKDGPLDVYGSLVPNSIYFMASNGQPSLSIPTSGLLLGIGIALTDTILHLHLSDGVIRG